MTSSSFFGLGGEFPGEREPALIVILALDQATGNDACDFSCLLQAQSIFLRGENIRVVEVTCDIIVFLQQVQDIDGVGSAADMDEQPRGGHAPILRTARAIVKGREKEKGISISVMAISLNE
jgi:hypothetical protein